MILHPEYIFKFKAVDSDKQMKRFMEILENHSIYFPRPYDLNDPMEANSVCYHVGTAGSGYTYAAGKVPNVIENYQNEFRILSFTTNPGSSLMWAHYSKEYKGCCLIFSAKTVFHSIEPVIYSDYSFSYGEGGYTDEIFEVIRESFLFKNTDWAYENEWRLIRRDAEDELELLDFKDELLGVIVGENIRREYCCRIKKFCKANNLPCFLTYTMNGINCIQFIPVEMDNGFYTPYDVQNHVNAKISKGLCASNEVLLFNVLNEVMKAPEFITEADKD